MSPEQHDEWSDVVTVEDRWRADLAGVGRARALGRPRALAIDAVFGRGQAPQKVNAFDAASAYCELLAADRTVELQMGDRDR